MLSIMSKNSTFEHKSYIVTNHKHIIDNILAFIVEVSLRAPNNGQMPGGELFGICYICRVAICVDQKISMLLYNGTVGKRS